MQDTVVQRGYEKSTVHQLCQKQSLAFYYCYKLKKDTQWIIANVVIWSNLNNWDWHRNRSDLRLGICVKYFLSFPQKKTVARENWDKLFSTFQFLNDKIDQNTNFAKLPCTRENRDKLTVTKAAFFFSSFLQILIDIH